MHNLAVLMMCAGSGSRMGCDIPKAYITINSRPIFHYSFKTFSDNRYVDKIFFVINQDHIELFKQSLSLVENSTKYGGFFLGGSERSQSVTNGLKGVDEIYQPDFIAIHDAARPFLTDTVLNRTFEQALITGAASPAIGVVDTIKEIDSSGFIKVHFRRKSLRSIQTPQIFSFQKLLAAYKDCINPEKYTDDTEIYSLNNNNIALVEGDRDLFKVTYSEDLDRARRVLDRS